MRVTVPVNAAALIDEKTNWTAFAVGAGTLVVILLLKGSKRLPGILIAVVGATVVVGTLDLATRAGVSVLGSLPQGLPAFAIPWITYADIVNSTGRGRSSGDQTSYSERGNLQGAQFWALAGRIYELAKAQGLGREIPTEWFLQDIRE